MTPILALEQISKRYGAVEALKEVSLTANPGEVLAICGDNGAGKSTLIKIVAGAHSCTSGTMTLAGRPVRWHSPHDALAQGVATIYQDLALAPELSIWQNIFIGSELTRCGIPGGLLLDKKAMRTQALDYLQRLHQRITDVNRRVADLSGGQRQAVAIARALRWDARLVVMDEPTAALGVSESAEVLSLITHLKAQGITVLLISHNMEDVIRVADRVVILKAGCVATQGETAGVQPAELAQAIITGQWPHATAAS